MEDEIRNYLRKCTVWGLRVRPRLTDAASVVFLAERELRRTFFTDAPWHALARYMRGRS
jgi:hypothetical protein